MEAIEAIKRERLKRAQKGRKRQFEGEMETGRQGETEMVRKKEVKKNGLKRYKTK